MPKNFRLALSVAALFSTVGLTGAAPLTVAANGVFLSSDSPTASATPSATWRLMFSVDNQPKATNAGSSSFDVPFSNFSYLLNGNAVSISPESIRLYSAATSGLFTVFFGPESGTGPNGNFVPEFTFSGPQLFSGSAQNPSILPGSYAVSETLYVDSVNFDDQVHPGTSVSVTGSSSATPEPASLALVVSGLVLACCSRRFAKRPGKLA